MNRPLTVASPAEPRVRLRAAGRDDLEPMRIWRNASKAGFFFKGEINELMQKAWYAAYLERANDFMFIVEHDGKMAGCLGFRVEQGRADLYNVIATPSEAGQGLMAAAMRVLCSYIAEHHTREITCKVLKGNEALKYYGRCGFRAETDCGDHDVLALDWSEFKPVGTIAS